MQTKVCSRCRIEKDVVDFPKCQRDKSGYHSWCKQCYKERRETLVRYDIDLKVMSKQCLKCLHVLPASQFGRDVKYEDGMDRWCKRCKNTASREWRKKNPYKHTITSRIYRTTGAGVYQSLRTSAKHRRMEYPEQQEFIEWFNGTAHQCYYCGIKKEDLWCAEYIIEKQRQRLGTDRKDNKIGYLICNICFCCAACNKIKCDVLTEAEMLKIGQEIVKPKWMALLKERRLV